MPWVALAGSWSPPHLCTVAGDLQRPGEQEDMVGGYALCHPRRSRCTLDGAREARRGLAEGWVIPVMERWWKPGWGHPLGKRHGLASSREACGAPEGDARLGTWGPWVRTGEWGCWAVDSVALLAPSCPLRLARPPSTMWSAMSFCE